MTNTLTAATLKRRGMAAIEEGLRHGPVHILKRSKPAAVVLSAEEYRRLSGGQPANASGLTAMQWLLNLPATGSRSQQDIDSALANDRSW
ncbi:MAG: type II toxin-antitoxin system prevent-host-death family antitoxin [Sulfuritalea sp.]|nr:type II toxin-antitoxin system prevent-host-death family antitoxin [Sulfuritalea sp.]